MNGRTIEPTSSAIGLIVIVALYVTIGVMSAAGSVYIAKSIFSAKVEQIFFGLNLIPIAGFYLAFTAYFAMKEHGDSKPAL
jgi:phosphate/sulfate permease